jgi:flavin-dependent dehydrogenase
MTDLVQAESEALTTSDTRNAREADVAIIGGGPVGAAFSILLKRARPQTSVMLLERRSTPRFKIGESLLSTPTLHLRELGLSDAVLRRLFRSKFGQSFWWTGLASDRVDHHLDSRDMGETYHVERRPLEMLLLRMAEQTGVVVCKGTTANVGKLSADGNELRCRPTGGEEFVLRASLVCDASGAAARIPRAVGHYRRGAPGFNTTAYFGYFRSRPGAQPDIPYWTLNTSNHICFPQGWMWVIALPSWERSSDGQLGSMIDYLLDHRAEPEEELPTRSALGIQFDCTATDLVSIGVTVRDDDDTARHLPVADRFQHYVDRYPGLTDFMRSFALVERPYDTIQQFTQYRSIAHHATQVAGDGWLVMGDAAVFVNPLFAPGIKDGFKMARAAVPLVTASLDSGNFRREQFAEYEQMASELISLAFDENEMLYRGYRHPDAYERTTALRLTMGALIVLRLGRLPMPGEVWAPIWNRYLAVLAKVVEIERVADEENWPASHWSKEVGAAIDPFLAWLRCQDIVREARLSRIFTHYTDDLYRKEGSERDGYQTTNLCAICETLVPTTIARCPSCGHGLAHASPLQTAPAVASTLP